MLSPLLELRKLLLREVKCLAPGYIVRKWCSSEQRLHFLTHQPELHHSANFFRSLCRGKTLHPQSEGALLSGKGAGGQNSNPESVAGTRADWGPHHCFVSQGIGKTLIPSGAHQVSLPFLSAAVLTGTKRRRF